MKKLSTLFLLFFTLFGYAQIVNFTNLSLKNYLLSANNGGMVALDNFNQWMIIDTNGDGEIQISEASNPDIQALIFSETDLIEISGLTDFINIDYIVVSGNAHLQLIDLSGWSTLPSFGVENNPQLHTIITLGLINVNFFEVTGCPLLVNFNVNNLIGLETFNIGHLNSLDVHDLPLLQTITSFYGPLQTVELSNLPNLEVVDLPQNGINSITLNNLPKLRYLDISNNQINTLDLSNLNHNNTNYFSTAFASYFNGNLNNITSLDFSNTTFIYKIVSNNQLEYLNIKDGVSDYKSSNDYIELVGNPNLAYVCADEDVPNDLSGDNIEQVLMQQGILNCAVSSYCSFVPGGEFYTINGTTRFDNTANGCDENDSICPKLNFLVSNGSVNGNVIANITGNYSIPVQSGTHTITPILEIPTYFTISPASITVNFPTQTSPYIQDFCLTPNGIHNDLEVMVFSLDVARPGFDSTYKIILKNKGNQMQSGTVNFTFNDAILDFVSSNFSTTSQSLNNLSWAFTNLTPFTTQEILVTLNLNSPTETPPVNGGNVLSFTATITSNSDETPIDNTFTLSQIVVNSFDPNDKTCLEGVSITPDKVGEYVHYRIRFENTGTANAQNIVVKDMIDTTKFDIATLVPIDGSHSFVTRITNTNQVEFIFENIQLPFDDANNDGYVAFKIKTKSTLATGSSFSNTASIYFDYNFPIITNTATTTIQALANQDFEFSNYFELAPNPAQNELNIQAKKDIELLSISIYNTLGQLVMLIPNAKETISFDISNLTTGTYFVKVISDKGSSNSKFIKE